MPDKVKYPIDFWASQSLEFRFWTGGRLFYILISKIMIKRHEWCQYHNFAELLKIVQKIVYSQVGLTFFGNSLHLELVHDFMHIIKKVPFQH